ncbi:MAG: hypothetical protein ABEH47_02120 [Haloferacaceae archaeon]
MSTYRPGYCNIGPRQRRRRFSLAVAVLLAAVGYVAACLTGVFPRVVLPGVFVPLTVGFELLFQAVDAFCVRLAFLGQYDVHDDETTGTVRSAADRRADRARAAKLSAAAIGCAGVLTLAVTLAA